MINLCNKNTGFSLIEVLVSVVVLAIGLLGVAALHLNMAHYNHAAELRAKALLQVNNITDRMRANYQGVENGHYDNLSGIPSSPGCSNCTSAQVAQLDAYEWNTTNAAMLPSGQGTVARNGNQFTITLRWDNDRTGATGTGCSGDPEVDLTCLIMEVAL